MRVVWPGGDAHALHGYFNGSPESPDGRHVLVYVSKRPDAHAGAVCIVERSTGETAVLDGAVDVEDAHRQAAQQWVCGGAFVVYSTIRDGRWQVTRADPRSNERVVLATDRQTGWGSPALDEMPLHGIHWSPGAHRDLELVDVRTGAIRTALALEQVLADHRQDVAEMFAGRRPDSIFFPVLSPDGTRVFFKLAVVGDGTYRSPKASDREGLFVYDIARGRSLGLYRSWGHPSWMPDSRTIVRKSILIDSDTMATRAIPWYPERFNSHPGPSPDGTRVAMDILRPPYSAADGHWTVIVGDLGNSWRRVWTAARAGDGTASWRPAHPHPVFSPDGHRLYWNANDAPWTTLRVTEVDPPAATGMAPLRTS